MKTSSKVCMVLSAVLMIITGIVALFNPGATLVSLAWLIGVLTLVSGIATLAFYFSEAKGRLGAGTVLFLGISDVILGIIFLNHSFMMAQILVFFVGLWLTIFGVERFLRSFDLKKIGYGNWWISLLLGIALTVLGVLNMMTPMAGDVLVSLVVGLGFILHGAAIFALLHALKEADRSIWER